MWNLYRRLLWQGYFECLMDKKTMPTTDRRLMIVLAHPDDESFAIGGTIAKYSALGVRITLVYATQGEMGVKGLDASLTGILREKELRAAGVILGASDIRFLGYMDGMLSLANPKEVVINILQVIKEIKPQIIITFGSDGISGHPDHVAISRLTTKAYDRSRSIQRLFYIAPSEATQQGCGVVPSQEIAGGHVAMIDIKDHLITKVRAAQCHISQKPPYKGSPEEEAKNLACHEIFTWVRPKDNLCDLDDLFYGCAI